MANNVFKIGPAVQFQQIPTGEAPSSPVDGMLYYDSTLSKFRKYEGGSWSDFSAGAVTAGVAGRLALYPSSGSSVDDVYVQNTQNIDVEIAAQGTRSAPLVYTFPNPGDAVSAASVVLTEGDQTINGNKTFGNDVVITGDLTVNGTATTVSTANLLVEDKLITLNDGGGAASGGGSGIEIEENASVTGYFKSSADRNSWELKAPNVAGVATISPNATSHTYSLPNADGTLLTDVVQDTTPQLGGELDVNGNAIASASNGNIAIAPHGTGRVRYAKQGALTRYVDEQYIDAISLTASTTAVASSFTFDSTTIKAQSIEYTIHEATTNRRRVGKIMVIGDAASAVASSNVSIVDTSAETADVGVVWSAALNGNNIELSYTTTANAKTMQAMVKRFLA